MEISETDEFYLDGTEITRQGFYEFIERNRRHLGRWEFIKKHNVETQRRGVYIK